MVETNEDMQIALVTGAGRGIGKQIAVSLAKAGRYVYINFHSNKEKAQQTLDEILKDGGKAQLLQFDVTDNDACETALDHIFNAHGRIDILVNNAGIRDDRLLVRMKEDHWQKVLDTNLTGFFNVTRPVVKKMLPKRWGRIINITSISGQMGQPGQVNYSASKAGLIGATQALAKEIASRNITVNALAPGFIETDMIQDLALDEISKSIPAGRVGKPEEVAATVLFLCSEGAAYITGQVIGVNGGMF